MTQIIIGRDYPDVLTEYVKAANNSIKILMYDWRWYSHQPASRIQKLNQEILSAVNRKVNVQAVVSSGVIWNILNQLGIKAKVSDHTGKMHIKMVIIDQKYLFIGSHNFSINAFELNHEISVLLDDQEAIASCDKFFDTIFI